ncbi:MAG: type II toxin-antitoxin system RelE/ParE family toxin [Acidobacteria bacterium]|nr:type II toxin-antitoxin system RelE/ParE family toxin [Acidobacteriota bacterium]
MADTRSTVKQFPATVCDEIGYGLYLAQLGDMGQHAKPLHGLGAGVLEISARDPSGTYRAVYTVSVGEAIYVLHAFQKKSNTGIGTPKREIDLVRKRLQQLLLQVKNVPKKTS